MPWYYADNGRQVGPVEEPALDDLVRAGVVRDDTLVWRDGMANWQPHSMVRAPRPPTPMPAVPMAAGGFCSECGRPFPMDQLVAIGNASVCAQCKPVYLQRVREGGQAIGARHYGGFWIRFVARIIDGIITGVAMTIVAIPLGGLLGVGLMRGFDPSSTSPFFGFAALGLYMLLAFAFSFVYEVYFISKRGATPGKMILNLKVIHPDGALLTTGQAVGRYFGYILSGFIFYIGYIIAAFDPEKRALHDRLVDSRVIYTK